MGIDVDRIGDFLESCEDRSGLVPEFRKQFPGVSLTRCDPFDMREETPVKSIAGFDLYLVDGRDHCVKITADADVATGVVLAESRK